jgi:hypothetical protein
VGTTAAETAHEVDQTRQQMGEKVSELASRAPMELRQLGKRVIFAVLTAVAVMLTRKLLDRAWTKITGERPPTAKAKS